jgi:electron transport complex protein RnfB
MRLLHSNIYRRGSFPYNAKETRRTLSSDPYERLAETLDKIPNGYPAVESGAHLRVLEWIFTPEEANLASQMKLMGETVEQLAERLEIPVEWLKERLDTMAEKGQIRKGYSRSKSAHLYSLMPFAVGIYEEQLGRMDEEFARRFEDYFQEGGLNRVAATNPAIFRVIPVEKKIDTELEIFPYQQAHQLIENAKSWGVRECICKKQQALLGNPCKYPTTVCLIFNSRHENAFDDDPLTESITKEELLKLLRDAEDAGLVHCASNVQEDHNYICNCCTCCCGILRGVKNLANPGSFVKSDFIVHIDDELCTGCGTCVERCQFEALSVPEDVSVLIPERCIGCGVCTVTCPEGALSLVDRPEAEKTKPPVNTLDWMTQRAMSRGVDPSELL